MNRRALQDRSLVKKRYRHSRIGQLVVQCAVSQRAARSGFLFEGVAHRRSRLNPNEAEPRIVLWCGRAKWMHHYEFLCRACNRPFSKIRTPIEPDEGKVVCPWCGSEEVEQRWFYLVAAKQSA